MKTVGFSKNKKGLDAWAKPIEPGIELISAFDAEFKTNPNDAKYKSKGL